MAKAKKQNKGFRVMDKDRVREICTMGGHACACKPGHMAKIGRRGGMAKGRK